MCKTADDVVVEACGEACIDEIAHLDPTLAGKVIGHVIRFHTLNLEIEKGDDAVRAFFASLVEEADKIREKFEELAAKPNPLDQIDELVGVGGTGRIEVAT
jgi:hypothetical protein